MSAETNLSVYHQTLAAFASRDLEPLQQLWSPDIVYSIPGNSVQSGEHRGREAALAVLARAFEISNGTIHADLEDLQADGDDRLIARFHVAAERDGQQSDWRVTMVTMYSGGRLVRIDDEIEPLADFEKFYGLRDGA